MRWRGRPVAELVFPVLVLFLVFLLLLRLDTGTFLHLAQTKGVRHERLISSLLLLLDCEERVFTNLGSGITSGVGVLSGDEVLVRRANLWADCELTVSY